MDPKRPSHLDEPPAASPEEEMEEVSSEEEVEEEEDPSEDEEEEEEEEEEAEQNGAKNPNPLPSDSGDDSSSDEIVIPGTPAPKANGFSAYGAAGVDSSLMWTGLTHLPKSIVSRGLDLLPEDKKAELLAEWEKIQLAEMDIFMRKSKLMGEQARLIAEALKR